MESKELISSPHVPDTFDQKRKYLRVQSVSENVNVRSSLQPCNTPYMCMRRLEALSLQHKKDKKHTATIKGLMGVLLHLTQTPGTLCDVDDDNKQYVGFLSFEEAYDIYSSHIAGHVTDKIHFRDCLLDSRWGLCVDIITFPVTRTRYVVLKSSFLHMPSLISEMEKVYSVMRLPTSSGYSGEEVQTVLWSMDTEWDRKCAKVLYASGKENPEIKGSGIRASTFASESGKTLEIAKEVKDTVLAANDLVKLRLQHNEHTLEIEMRNLDEKIKAKSEEWSECRLSELHDQRETATEKLTDIQSLLNADDKYSRLRVRQSVKRMASNLAEDNRLKRRKLGAGPTRRLDSDDEDFVAKAIEEKATYHGRRHDTVMYTNRRVKAEDLLNIANCHLRDRHKRPIKSAITVWNRSRPRKQNTIQASRHIGKGLFCTKKPPKAEDNSNVNVHHQRAHVKNVQQFLFQKDFADYSFIHSMDDKATVKPGTSDGFEKTRNVKILTVSDGGGKQLPKYDWPERKMHQTPAAHRIMEKETVVIDDTVTLLTKQDRHFVIVRPKAYIDSSGTTWASDTVRLRQEYPNAFEMRQSHPQLSCDIRTRCASVHDAAFQFKDMTLSEDTDKVSGLKDCPYRMYEMKRITHLTRQLSCCSTQLGDVESTFCDGEQEIASALKTKLELTITFATDALNTPTDQHEVFCNTIHSLAEHCFDLLELIDTFRLPKVKPFSATLTDAGPGVGVSNVEVKFRDAELVRLCNSSYKIRVHRANGDSGQNEAERTNSGCGDSIVDGGTIHWEATKQFDGMSKEDISALTLQAYEELEEVRACSNAWNISKQLVSRIDDAPVLSEFIKSLLTQSSEEQFFFNKTYLRQYLSATPSTKSNVPGAGYFSKIYSFIDQHYQFGELYMEYLKESCMTGGALCEFCSMHTWNGPAITRIPRPAPDYNQLPEYHYQSVFETSLDQPGGETREPDDFQPRACLKATYSAGEISLDDETAISAFADKYIVTIKLLKEYLCHLTNLDHVKTIRSGNRQTQQLVRKNKAYSEYDWYDLVSTGKLGKLNVQELNKYSLFNNLSCAGKKPDKLRRVIAHVAKNHGQEIFPGARVPCDADSENSDSESDDEVTQVVDYHSDLESESINSESSDGDSDSDSTRTPIQAIGEAANMKSRSGRILKPTTRFFGRDYINV